MNRKNIVTTSSILFITVFMIISTLVVAENISLVAGASSIMSNASFCCERTNAGAWCINADESQCDSSYDVAPTSCETTSYCRLGTCYESDEGICMERTPQRVCNDNGGTWDPRDIEQVPQCQLGCCIMSDQAAFVSLVRCKKLSTMFGIKMNYRTDIKNEVSCIDRAQSQTMGACVYEKDFERTCKFTTRGDCGASEGVESVSSVNKTTNDTSTSNASELSTSSKKTFYEGLLCSAEELNTDCAKEVSTTCYQGDVYWVDSCGNRENVYSSDKVRSWNNGRILDADKVCQASDGSNIDCGNCDYLSGSRCAKYDKYLGGPKYGDNYCRKDVCIDNNGKKRLNGESWCVYSGNLGNSSDPVGLRYFREICIDGKVHVEPCADYRNEICISDQTETDGGNFENAACVVNRWQDCVLQTDKDECNNIDKRDCRWLPAVTGMILGGGQSGSNDNTAYSNPSSNTSFKNPTTTGKVVAPITGAFFGVGDDSNGDSNGEEDETTTNRPNGICVPDFSPGLKFWGSGSAQQVCGQANAKCVVKYEKGLIFGKKKIVEGKECLEEKWALDANRVCTALGDCGGYVNYQGEYTDDGYKWIEDGTNKKFSKSSINIISDGFNGMAVGEIKLNADDYVNVRVENE